jgi:hypothetical protein
MDLNFQVNFARIGTDLAAILLEAAFEIGEEYKEILFTNNQYNVESEDDILFKNTLEGEALKCINQLVFYGAYAELSHKFLHSNLFPDSTTSTMQPSPPHHRSEEISSLQLPPQTSHIALSSHSSKRSKTNQQHST